MIIRPKMGRLILSAQIFHKGDITMKQIIQIEDVIGREIIDSRGNPTVEVEVYL